jgi:hypothetical protein
VRWPVDECADADLVTLLRASGHDVVYMAEVAPRSADAEVMHRADRENRLLLTEDKDFGDLVFRQQGRCPASSFCASSHRDVCAKGRDCWLQLNDSVTHYSVATPLLKMPGSVPSPPTGVNS